MKTFTGILIFFLIFLTGCASECNAQAKLKLVTRVKKTGIAYGLSVDKGYAYITNNDGLVIVDIHEPRNPEIVTRLNIGEGFGVFVKDDIAYVLAGKGLITFDVKDPLNPIKLGETPISGYVKHLRLFGSYLYIGSEQGLEIYDAHIPGRIKRIGHYGDSQINGMEENNGIAYIATINRGVEVLDISEPSSPQRICVIDGTQKAFNVHVHKEQLYVARHSEGLAIIDISDIESPKLIGNFKDDNGGEAIAVWGDGNLLIVDDNYSTELLDITDPANPLEIDSIKKAMGHAMAVVDNYIYVTGKGLLVFELIKD